MEHIFLNILSIGMNVSWMILAILCLRLVLRKSSKRLVCVLWILLGVRLLCPYSIESAMSLVPVQLEIPAGDSLGSEKNVAYVHIQPNSFGIFGKKSRKQPDLLHDAGAAGENHKGLNDAKILNASTGRKVMLHHSRLRFFTAFWVCGVIGMCLYFILNCFCLSRKTRTATRRKDNIWESEFVDSPYIFGVLRPRIYIPYGIDDGQLSYILAHEQAHLKRNDHILKAAAYLILSVYWFHPLVWIAYIFFGRDMEYACDEKAVAHMNSQEKKNYLLALLSCSVAKKRAIAYPLAFGKIGIKERVIRIKNWKKPSVVLLAFTLFAGMIVLVCFFTIPRTQGAGEAANQTEASTDSAAIDVQAASIDLNESTGADGTTLYYVDSKKIIFGGTYGLFVYDKISSVVTRSLDLEYIGCQYTQGDQYCEIAVRKDGWLVYLHPANQKKLYIWDWQSDELEEKECSPKSIWQDESLELFRTEDAKQIVYHDGSEKMVCMLQENDFTAGNCACVEYSKNGKRKQSYYALFSS